MFLQRNQEENAELKDFHEYILLIGQDVETSLLLEFLKCPVKEKILSSNTTSSRKYSSIQRRPK